MIRSASLTLFLAAVWLLLSGHFEPLILSFGAASVALVVFLAHRMDVVDHEGHPVHLSWKLPVYWLWLVWQIVLSNLSVARKILSPDMRIDPRLISVDAGQKDDLDRVVYANSITLTPGTVSLRLDEGKILVHALDEGFAEDLERGTMRRRVRRFAGGG
ncbi:MAG: Na+/H+ antiporter subunit E [Candidatus Krumholzibacteria bacterium]